MGRSPVLVVLPCDLHFRCGRALSRRDWIPGGLSDLVLTGVQACTCPHCARQLSADAGGCHRVLIEDDGDGMAPPTVQGVRDKHGGPTIMQEQAWHINGNPRVERSLGECTRVALTFYYLETRAPEFAPVMAAIP